jgi:hypothetical protein
MSSVGLNIPKLLRKSIRTEIINVPPEVALSHLPQYRRPSVYPTDQTPSHHRDMGSSIHAVRPSPLRPHHVLPYQDREIYRRQDFRKSSLCLTSIPANTP